MKLAIVLGQVVATVRSAGLEHERLVLIDFVGPTGERMNTPHVAVDRLGAGNGEWVLVVQGSSARITISEHAPIDMSIMGIVDEVVLESHVTYHK